MCACMIAVPADPQFNDIASATPQPTGPLWVRPIIQNMDFRDTEGKSGTKTETNSVNGPS